MSKLGRVDAISITYDIPEKLRDAPLATIRRAVRENAEMFLENLAQAIHKEFVSTPRTVHSIEEAANLGRIDAAKEFDRRVKLFTM